MHAVGLGGQLFAGGGGFFGAGGGVLDHSVNLANGLGDLSEAVHLIVAAHVDLSLIHI